MTARTSLALLILLPTLSFAQKTDQKTWIDPAVAAKEDPDFTLQGEYLAQNGAFGGQVVALGGGKFDLYLLEGGLPGAGWEKGKKRVKLTGEINESLVTFPKIGPFSALLEDGTLLVKTGEEDPLSLPRVERKSPTLGAKAPEGATVLFDGSGVEQWENGKMEDGLLQATGTLSKAKFKDCHLHLEFRTPYKPHARGQQRGNSGVYYGGRWETQVLDSFALEGRMNECGGIYSIAAPDLNMCLPPLTWQTYDVDFTAAKFDQDGNRTAWPRMTVRLNGVIIHDDRELPKDLTTAAPAKGPLKDEALPIFLQDHGNPVVFRNIWAMPK
jgi:hypothetical protein